MSKLLLLLLITSGAVLISRNENPITRSELFLELEDQTAARVGAPLSLVMRTVIQLQTYSYPIAEAIRSRVLLGITYDFDPETETPPFENPVFREVNIRSFLRMD